MRAAAARHTRAGVLAAPSALVRRGFARECGVRLRQRLLGVRALLEAYLDEDARGSLPVSSRVTVTLRLTGEEGAPFRYLACTRSVPEE